LVDRGSPDEGLIEESIRRAAKGDAQAYGDLYELFVRRIHRYVAYRCGDRETVDDLVHEIFLQAYQALPRYEHRSTDHFLRWLYGVARRVVAGHYRRRDVAQRAHAVLEAEASDRELRSEDFTEAIGTQDMLRELTDEQRRVIVMRFYASLTPEEIGDRMGLKPGAVRALQFRALRKLRGLWG